MTWPVRSSLLFIVLVCSALAADNKGSSGRLATGCVDRSVGAEFCGWVARYHAKDTPIRARSERTIEQKAVESSLSEYLVIQPAQIQGARASVLVQRSSGEFAVASLTKHDGTWSIVSVSEPSPAH
jgi:hypothetical protein